MSAEVVEFRPRRRPWWWWLAAFIWSCGMSLAAWVIFRAVAGWPMDSSILQRIAG